MSVVTRLKVLNELNESGFDLEKRLILDDSVIEGVVRNVFGTEVNTVQIIRECYPILSLTKVDGVIKIVVDREYNPLKSN